MSAHEAHRVVGSGGVGTWPSRGRTWRVPEAPQVQLVVTKPVAGVSSFWDPPSPAYEYARNQMNRLSAEYSEAGLPEPAPLARARMLILLKQILDADSVYPTMAVVEDGGLTATWLYETASEFEIDVDPDGDMTWTVRKEGRLLNRQSSVSVLRRELRDLSAYVELANPSWRSLFPGGHQRSKR